MTERAATTRVSAAGDTAASTGKTLTYVTGPGTDSFTGGFENDTVNVSAAAVGGDTLTGGSGTNTLTLTSAGSVNLGGVSKFGTIDLAAGSSTVTVTDTTLSGGAVTIKDGASGNNSISAAGDTSASSGTSLTYDAGSREPTASPAASRTIRSTPAPGWEPTRPAAAATRSCS